MTKLGLAAAVVLVCCTNAPGPAGPAKVAEVPAKVAETPTKVATPTAEPGPGEDWLVWWFRGGAWTTRWVRVDGEAASTVAERRALIVGDAARLWQVERADTQIDVKQCDCEGEDVEKCPVIGKVGKLGLQARELGGAGVVDVRKASTEAEWGDDMEYSLAVVGGSQGRVIVEVSESGYFCGAHGSYFTSYATFDVAAGRAFAAPKDWWKGLPAEVKQTAAKEILEGFRACEESDVTVEEIVSTRLGFTGASLGLKGGAPQIGWRLAAEVPYVCSSDYALTGTATSGMISEAAPIGLGGPLPVGIIKGVLAEIGEADALGVSRLELPPADRAGKLAAFSAAPEQPWPPETTTLQRRTASEAQLKLEEGRKATREKEFVRAVAAFDAAIAIDGALASAYSGRGYAHMLAGDAKAARADFDAALARSGEKKLQAAVWFNLGGLAEQAGDVKAARVAYEKSQALRASKQAAAALAALAAKK